MNTGRELCRSRNGLLTTIAVGLNGSVQYALEGSVFVGGAVIQWVRDELRFFSESGMRSTTPRRCRIPAGSIWSRPSRPGSPLLGYVCQGLPGGAHPGHDPGTHYPSGPGVHRLPELGSGPGHGAGHRPALAELRVDGGASRDRFLMQFQADILDKPVRRPMIRETTALGAAIWRALRWGCGDSLDEIRAQWTLDRLYQPRWRSPSAGLCWLDGTKPWAAA